MAAVGVDCYGDSPSQRMRIVQQFGLRTFVRGKAYVPLSGFPPGVTSDNYKIAAGIFAFTIPFILFLLE
jgi:hypothetical protein